MYTYEDIRKLVEEIRLMNRAKLILIKMRGMTEAEAHRCHPSLKGCQRS